MQSLLYLIEEADAHYRVGRYNLALKKYIAIQKVWRYISLLHMLLLNASYQIFNEIEDDQYDFHGYNLRKFTINIYMKSVPEYLTHCLSY